MPGFFCTDLQLAQMMGATINTDGSAPDMSSGALLKTISPIALDIKKTFADQSNGKFILLEVEPIPVTNEYLVTEMLNLIRAGKQMVAIKTGDISIELRKQSKTFERIEKFLWSYFDSRILLNAWIYSPLPIAALCDRSDCYITTAGSKDNTNLTLGITNDQLDRMILRIGAFVRARAKQFRNYPQASLSASAALVYKEQVASLVRVFNLIAFSRSKKNYSEDVDRVVNDWLDIVQTEWYEFDMGLKVNSFRT